MSHAGTPILVSVASPLLEILLLSKTAKFPFPTMDIKKFSWSESAQKIHACRDWCHMHACQFWWVELFRFWRFFYFQKRPKFPFLTIVIKKFSRSESAQKIHASRDWYHMHAHQFWWVEPFQFWRFFYFQKRTNFPFWPWTIVYGHQKILSIGISSKY